MRRAFLFLCLYSLVDSGTSTRTGATSGEAELYEFSPAECPSLTFGSSKNILPTTHTLTGNSDILACPETLGVTTTTSPANDASGLRSSVTIAELLDESKTQTAKPKGLSFELWVKPRTISSVSESTVFAVQNSGDLSSLLNRCTVMGGYFDFRVQQLQYGDGRVQYTVDYTTRDGACDSVSSARIAPGYFHLVVTLGASKDIIYVNGQNVDETTAGGGNSDFEGNWADAYKFDFFNDGYGSASTFKGDLLMFASYPFELSAAEVLTNFGAGVSESLPAVSSATLTINEDAEDTPNSHDISWYRSQQSVADIQFFNINVIDLDEEASLPGQSSSRSRVYLSTLPANGQLFLPNNNDPIVPTPDGNTEVPFRSDSNSYSLKYRPSLNANGASFDSFKVFAVDGDTGDRSISDATITFNVDAVNDPPFAHTYLNKTVQSGVPSSSVLDLSGYDVDNGDSISGYFVTSFPTHGDLYQVTGGNTYGSKITETGSPVELTTGKVGYIYTGSEENVSNLGKLNDDSFTFQLKDSSGISQTEMSNTATFNLGIFTALFATPTTSLADITAVEEEVSDTIKLKGYDSSSVPRNLRFQIVSLPSHGQLFDVADSSTQPLQVGSILTTPLASPYNGHVTVGYKGNNNYFNWPSVSSNNSKIESDYDTFQYRAVVSDSTSIKSLAVTQQVRVKNVNDASVLNIPTNTDDLKVYAFSSLNPKDCEGDKADNPACRYSDTLKISGITVEDADRNVDEVVVKLSTKNGGQLTINPENKDRADFLKCLSHLLDWDCGSLSDGDDDEKMIFVASPYDVNRILADLEYKCLEEDIIDTVTVEVYDGSTGLCLRESEHNTASVRTDGCLITSKSFNVTVATFSFNVDEKTWDGWLPFGWTFTASEWGGVFAGLAAISCCFCSVVRHKYKKRRKRRREMKEGKAKKDRKKKKKQKSGRFRSSSEWSERGKEAGDDDLEEGNGGMELPVIAGSEGLQQGVRDTKKKGGLKNIGLKGVQAGLNIGEKGLNKANKLKIGGPAVGLAMKGLNVAKGMVEEELDDGKGPSKNLPPPPPPAAFSFQPPRPPQQPAGGLPPPGAPSPPPLLSMNNSNSASQPPPPPQQEDQDLKNRPVPPPPPKKEIPKWLGHTDDTTGETYFESTDDGRTTWTEPKEGYKKV